MSLPQALRDASFAGMIHWLPAENQPAGGGLWMGEIRQCVIMLQITGRLDEPAAIAATIYQEGQPAYTFTTDPDLIMADPTVSAITLIEPELLQVWGDLLHNIATVPYNMSAEMSEDAGLIWYQIATAGAVFLARR